MVSDVAAVAFLVSAALIFFPFFFSLFSLRALADPLVFGRNFVATGSKCAGSAFANDAGSFRESQLYFSFHGIDIVVVSHGETELLANTLHRLVFTEDLPEYMFHSFLPADFE